MGMLYEDCNLCDGQGIILQKVTLQNGEVWRSYPCMCESRRVLPVGVTAKQLEVIVQERMAEQLKRAEGVAP